MKNSISTNLPKGIELPLRFRERSRAFEGEVNHPKEILHLFEPVDVLNGLTELVDKNGIIITLHTDDQSIINKNEYPENFNGIYYKISNKRKPD